MIKTEGDCIMIKEYSIPYRDGGIIDSDSVAVS